jgi:hypothetical protein
VSQHAIGTLAVVILIALVMLWMGGEIRGDD